MEEMLGTGTYAPPTQETADTSSHDEEQEEKRGPLVVIPYLAGMSVDIMCVCRKFNIRVVFKSGCRGGSRGLRGGGQDTDIE